MAGIPGLVTAAGSALLTGFTDQAFAGQAFAGQAFAGQGLRLANPT
jgi:hypothetical protein